MAKVSKTFQVSKYEPLAELVDAPDRNEIVSWSKTLTAIKIGLKIRRLSWHLGSSPRRLTIEQSYCGSPRITYLASRLLVPAQRLFSR